MEGTIARGLLPKRIGAALLKSVEGASAVNIVSQLIIETGQIFS